MATIVLHGIAGGGLQYGVPPAIDFVDSMVVGTMPQVNHSPPVAPLEVTTGQSGMRISTLPIQEVEHTVTGVKAPSFLDDYYKRIHLIPGSISLGNLLSIQTRNVEVWNSFLEPELLSSITQLGTDGITLVQPVAAPTYFAALESRTYQLIISTNGSPAISASYAFNFPGSAPVLAVTGRRIVIWPFMPQTKHRESMEWKTDLIPSFNNEQRLALRPAPRQSFTFDFQLDQRQFSRAKAIASQWAYRVYGIPVWSELTRVGAVPLGSTEILFDTENMDFRENDLVLIWESDEKFVAAENSSVLTDRVVLKLPLEESYQNAYVSPLRFARTLQGMSFDRGPDGLTVTKGTFLVTANKDLGAATGWPTYRGKDVITDRTIIVGDLGERISRSVDAFDNGAGPIAVDPSNAWLRSPKTITFDTLTRAERWTARRWIHSRRGKQKGFWMPSWNIDLEILIDVDASASALTVRPIGYPLYYGVKDAMVVLNNGTRLFTRITSGSTDVDGNELLILGGAIGTSFAVADVDFVCFMSHVRFDSDRVDVAHGQAGRATITIPVVETPET